MTLKEHIYSVLLVSGNEKFTHSFAPILPAKNYAPIRTVHSVSEARAELAQRPYDLVIINAPLPDELGRRFALDISATRNTVALLILKSAPYVDLHASLRENGVLTVKKPLPLPLLEQALDFMKAFRERLRSLEAESLSLESKMAAIRTVNHAKWLLIDKYHLTEEEAHYRLEKLAMDSSLTKLQLAEKIIAKNKQRS